MLEGRRIVVTGASGGIGRSLARRYADAGGRVWAVARRAAELDATAGDSPAIVPVPADLTTDGGRRAVATAVDHAGGILDVVVHAAGALGPVGVPLADYPEEAWRSVLEVNLTAVHLLHQRLLPYLTRSASPAVIALSSTVGREARALWGMYAVSKHALEAWVATVALEWEGGRVYSVNPGGTRTTMRAAAVPDEDPATVPHPDEVSPLFLHLAHPDNGYATGAVLNARDWIGRDPREGISPAS